MQSTIEIFRHLYEHLPPLFPFDIKEKMGHALGHLDHDPEVNLEDIEKTMISFGYEVWPWSQAYKEFYSNAEARVGEHFLIPKLPPDLQEKYQEFKAYGGTLKDLHAGHSAAFFNLEERGALCAALIQMSAELRAYVERQVASTERNRYLKRVYEFGTILDDIKKTMGRLNDLADKEQDHPNLAREIRERVKSFEYGLCYLGPELDYSAVCQAEEFFAGRKHELNRLKGIAVPLEIDFFAEEIS